MELPTEVSELALTELHRPEPTLLYLGDHSKNDIPYGFRIYRTTYGDDGSWNRFMEYFKAQAQKSLEVECCEAVDLYQQLDLKVVESPDLDDADDEFVRARFLEWINSGEEQPDNSARFLACVVVDCDSLDSVMTTLEMLEEEGLPLDTFDRSSLAYVDIISRNENEESVHMCISYLYPRAFSFVRGLDWEFVQPEEGEYVAKP